MSSMVSEFIHSICMNCMKQKLIICLPDYSASVRTFPAEEGTPNTEQYLGTSRGNCGTNKLLIN